MTDAERLALLQTVPVHEHKGRPYYVCLGEILVPWQDAFRAALRGSRRSYGLAALVPVNDQLLADGEISPLQRERTVDTMATIRLVHGDGSNPPSTG